MAYEEAGIMRHIGYIAHCVKLYYTKTKKSR